MDIGPVISDASEGRPGSGAHRILVSAENNAYMAWQCQLLHYSCVTRLGQVPLIVVHGSARSPLALGFNRIISAGGLVRRAPSYRINESGAEYPPRNTPGTLLHASAMNYFGDDFFVLCDPDMIFVNKPDFANALSADGYPLVLNFDHRDVRVAARRYGVPLDTLESTKLQCGVPHVVPVADAASLAVAWLEAIDAFKSRLWEVSMYAFVMAVAKLGMDFRLTQLAFYNQHSHDRLPPDAAIIHYCCGDRIWTKRQYWADADATRVWDAPLSSQDGTVVNEILSQIRAAESFYTSYRMW
jgi:hypothetical protein